MLFYSHYSIARGAAETRASISDPGDYCLMYYTAGISRCYSGLNSHVVPNVALNLGGLPAKEGIGHTIDDIPCVVFVVLLWTDCDYVPGLVQPLG